MFQRKLKKDIKISKILFFCTSHKISFNTNNWTRIKVQIGNTFNILLVLSSDEFYPNILILKYKNNWQKILITEGKILNVENMKLIFRIFSRC